MWTWQTGRKRWIYSLPNKRQTLQLPEHCSCCFYPLINFKTCCRAERKTCQLELPWRSKLRFHSTFLSRRRRTVVNSATLRREGATARQSFLVNSSTDCYINKSSQHWSVRRGETVLSIHPNENNSCYVTFFTFSEKHLNAHYQVIIWKHWG